MKDLYETLCIDENATEQEIKKAYRKLAKQYHPDKCKTPECEEKFKEINAAHEVLSNKEKRTQYDRVGDAAFGNGGFHQYSQEHSEEDINDFFSQMFGGMGGNFQGFGYQEPNPDRIGNVKITLETAVNGGKLNIEGETINIPKGIKNGQRLRIKGKGHRYNRKVGDLIIQIFIQSDYNFEVIGNDIHTEVKLDIKEAIFGAIKKINLYGDKIKIKIPKDTKFGQQLRVKNKGLKGGNLIVHCNIELPKSNSIKEEDLSFI